ncbi:MAG: copper amine oxidase N-terminal domain-containing protein [Armatimonadota bacterium]|nr:copper amine oxidase N-terminal domain-containing protein [bacterium]
MRVNTLFAIAVMMVVLSASAFGQTTTTIPSYTVVPVTIDQSLSSATANVGDTFSSRCNNVECGGFPSGTRFIGRVTSVSRASGSTPGQIGVSFVQAILPTGVSVPISGSLSALDPSSVRIDPNTGLLTGQPGRRNQTNRFIAYGAGLGLIIGSIAGSNVYGALLGAAAGWLYGRYATGQAAGRDVVVSPGTQFGIMLNNPVRLPSGGAGPGNYDRCIGCPGYTGSGGGAGPGYSTQLTFPSNQQPFYTNNGVLMVPFRQSMEGINQPFSYDYTTRSVVMDNGINRISVPSNSTVMYVNGVAQRLSAPTRTIGGNLYVPVDVLTAATGMTAYWDQNARILTLQ